SGTWSTRTAWPSRTRGARSAGSSTAAAPRPATTPSSPPPGRPTRLWYGCGWAGPVTSTYPSRTRSVIPDRVAAALRTARRPVCAYVYDTTVLRRRAAEVKAALPATAPLLYAVKANGHPELVRVLADAADGVAVASGGELD